ncbi:hypothetical protein B0H21DRAFT_38771 [Amylocystis lapponica]|nr:hypothetical protein B0H21DRAFT_38771 [Amylocystis lapponica]
MYERYIIQRRNTRQFGACPLGADSSRRRRGIRVGSDARVPSVAIALTLAVILKCHTAADRCHALVDEPGPVRGPGLRILAARLFCASEIECTLSKSQDPELLARAMTLCENTAALSSILSPLSRPLCSCVGRRFLSARPVDVQSRICSLST